MSFDFLLSFPPSLLVDEALSGLSPLRLEGAELKFELDAGEFIFLPCSSSCLVPLLAGVPTAADDVGSFSSSDLE